ncbi:MAG TPA: pre-peptidase, partial [Isosphaeraceae bacterium]|nr:pre-peptidase [Isosphaeraceae bacterium]
MRNARIALLGAIVLLGPRHAMAKPPTLIALFPPGAARGQTVDVEATGTFDHWPVQGWVEGQG